MTRTGWDWSTCWATSGGTGRSASAAGGAGGGAVRNGGPWAAVLSVHAFA